MVMSFRRREVKYTRACDVRYPDAIDEGFYSCNSAPGPTATTKYSAGVVPIFLMPCSSFEATNPTDPGLQAELLVDDGQFYRPFPYEPHFRVGMMMRGGRGRATWRQRGLVYFDSFSRSQFSPQHHPDLRVVIGNVQRRVVERKCS